MTEIAIEYQYDENVTRVIARFIYYPEDTSVFTPRLQNMINYNLRRISQNCRRTGVDMGNLEQLFLRNFDYSYSEWLDVSAIAAIIKMEKIFMAKLL